MSTNELYELFEESLRIWHAGVYLVRRRPGPAKGVYRWAVIECDTGIVYRVIFDSHISNWRCGKCSYRDVIDGQCLHSLLVQIDTYVTAYENDRPDEDRRSIVAEAVRTVQEKLGITPPEPEEAFLEEPAGQRDGDAEHLLTDEDLYIEADETIIPWKGAYYGHSILDLTRNPEGRAYLHNLADGETGSDEPRRPVDEFIFDTARRVYAAITVTYNDIRAAAA